MPSKPLVVAGVAAVLLILVIGLDITHNRTLFIDQQTNQGGWVTVTQDPCCRGFDHPRGPNLIDANRTDNITFRLRIDNGFPWDYNEDYAVLVGNVEVARGRLTAGSYSEGLATFQVPANAFLGPPTGLEPPQKPGILYGSVEVEIDGKRLWVSANIREVAK